MHHTVQKCYVLSAMYLSQRTKNSTTRHGPSEHSKAIKLNQKPGNLQNNMPNKMKISRCLEFDVWCLKAVELKLKDKKPVQYKKPNTEDYFNEDTTNNYNKMKDILLLKVYSIQQPLTSNSRSLLFCSKDLSKICWVIKHTDIPLWLNQHSPIFGDASAGKVCLADWISLFKIFMSFAIVELERTAQHELVDSWYHLEMLTDIAIDYTTDQNKVHQYLYHLTSYQSNIAESHSHLDPTPNKHMAYHFPKQLQSFGPANFLASLHFEKINGIQQCPTNNKIVELDFTLLKHARRASNLDFPLIDSEKKLRSLIVMELLENIHNQTIRMKYVMPVPTFAKSIPHFKNLGLTYTDSFDKGSSSIKYKLPSDTSKTFIKGGYIKNLFWEDTKDLPNSSAYAPGPRENPYKIFCPNLNVNVFYSPPLLPEKDKLQLCDLITPHNLVYHIETYQHDLKLFKTEYHLIAVKSLSHSCCDNFI
ncbi:uncharacterized protein VP01_4806g1 [Puccinia sorghi]|uniref:Uncharacterized protein n=1 Tax=Puccinia sorghi TaxID=27349 RepID=A0A0L6UMM0_9BASI|nr:uncharacterized protein VP01_4806g1 [Puccinia sorghi]